MGERSARRVSTPWGDGHHARFLSPVEAAAHAGLSITKVRLMLSLGVIDGAVKLGKYWRVPAAAFNPESPTLRIVSR